MEQSAVRSRLLPATLGLLVVLCRPAGAAAADSELNAGSTVIPLPAQVVAGVGVFDLNGHTPIQVPRGDAGAAEAARYFVDLTNRAYGLALQRVTPRPSLRHDSGGAAGARPAIAFQRRAHMGPEAYAVAVAPDRIVIRASTDAGLFYGAVTLWQLIPTGPVHGTPLGSSSGAAIPAQGVLDAPRYAWRGLMLDSSRHFQSPAFIRSMLDWMAWHKLNVLHWHLTDDQGWRLEIRRYPKLTAVGAWRTPALPELAGAVAAPPARYGGFYTQSEVRGLVAYAASRHIQVVPEIDMPGHAQAAIAAYPELGVATVPLAVSNRWGVHTHLFNVEPATFTFLENVLAEVIELFPSAYVHVGGDEAVKAEWNASPAVQTRIHALGLHDADELQVYFTQQIGRYLAAHGRRLIGWDEILRPGIDQQSIVMSWHGTSGAHAAAVQGNDSVLTPWPRLYFDNRQSTLPTEVPGRLTVESLEDVYAFSPADPSLTPAQARRVLGVQANLWSEHLQTGERLDRMALPRAAALAEVGWTAPARRNWPAFLERLPPLFARYEALGIPYADSVFGVAVTLTQAADTRTLSLAKQATYGEIRYTTDGSVPGTTSPVYTTPLAVAGGTTLRAATFVGGNRVSTITTQPLTVSALARRDSHDLELCSNAVGLLLEPAAGSASRDAPLAIDIMNPCWIERAVDLSTAGTLTARVVPLPFNFEIGAAVSSIRVGDARSTEGELEIHVDGCDTPAAATVPLASAVRSLSGTTLPRTSLPRLPGRHDLCLKVARPRLDPQWGLDWVEVGE